MLHGRELEAKKLPETFLPHILILALLQILQLRMDHVSFGK